MIQFIDFLISVSLALIMFTIGLSLVLKDFKKIFRYPKKLILGLASQIILLPLLTFLIIETLGINLPTEIKMGILILALCPGGTTSNFISYLTKLDTPLSISLTSINTFIVLFSIPFLTNFFLKYYLNSSNSINLPYIKTMLNLFFIIIIPVILGIYIRIKNENFAKKVEKTFKIISISVIAIIFTIKFFASESAGGSGITFQTIWKILPVLLIIHILSLFMGFFNSKFFKINNKSAITIGIEVGLQNTGLALLVTNNLLDSQLMLQPILVYAMFSFFTTTGFALYLKKKLTKDKKFRKHPEIYGPL